MSRVRLTFFRPQDDPDDQPSVKSSLNLADWGVKGGLLEPTPDVHPAPREIGRQSEAAEDETDPLAVFGSEGTPREPHVLRRDVVRPAAVIPSARFPDRAAPPAEEAARSRHLLGLALLLVVGAGAASAGAMWGGRSAASPEAAAAEPAGGRALINSNPPGVVVYIDDVARGTTPVDLVLPAGTHTVQLQQGPVLRTLPLEIVPNQITSQYVELPVAPAAGPAVPAGPPAASQAPAVAAQTRAGGASTPVRPPAPGPGTSSTSGRSAGPAASRPTPATSPASAPPPAVVPSAPLAEGWVRIVAPFPVQVSEAGRTLGSTSAGPLRLSPGLHTLDLVNPSLEFSSTLAVNVTAGQTTSSPLTIPNGTLSVNALPWAEVFVDGQPIGTTPLANVAVPIGSREVLWRHPQFGERRQMVRITARTPVRIGTDFNR